MCPAPSELTVFLALLPLLVVFDLPHSYSQCLERRSVPFGFYMIVTERTNR